MIIDITLMIKSFLVGFIIATPAGAASIMCLRRLLSQGPLAGAISALGISVADIVFITLASYSLTMVSGFLLTYQNIIRCLGGIIVILFGIRILLKKHFVVSCPLKQTKYLKLFSTTFFLTISNPMVIMFLTTILTSIGLKEAPSNALDAITLISWAFLGSYTWWILIIGSMIFFRFKPKPNFVWHINKISGILLVICGISFLIKSII